MYGARTPHFFLVIILKVLKESRDYLKCSDTSRRTFKTPMYRAFQDSETSRDTSPNTSLDTSRQTSRRSLLRGLLYS